MNHLENIEIKIDVINFNNNLNQQEQIKMILKDPPLPLLLVSYIATSRELDHREDPTRPDNILY